MATRGLPSGLQGWYSVDSMWLFALSALLMVGVTGILPQEAWAEAPAPAPAPAEPPEQQAPEPTPPLPPPYQPPQVPLGSPWESAPAPAQDSPPVLAAPARATEPSKGPELSFGAMMAVSHVSESGSSDTVATPVLQGFFGVLPQLGVQVEWPLALMVDSEGLGSASARTGNPSLFGWYRGKMDRLQWRLGMGVTAPLATVSLDSDGRVQRQLLSESAAVWGFWDSWRWATGRMAVPVSASLTYELTSTEALVADASSGIIFGVRNHEHGTDPLGQVSVGLRLWVTPNFWLSPRLHAVLLPSASVDRLQTAVGVRAEWASSAGRLFLGCLINLDEPVGVFGRGTQAWGIHLGKELDL